MRVTGSLRLSQHQPFATHTLAHTRLFLTNCASQICTPSHSPLNTFIFHILTERARQPAMSHQIVQRNAIAAAEKLLVGHPKSFGRNLLSVINFNPHDLRIDPRTNELQLRFKPSSQSCNAVRSMHGGAIATLADVFTTIHLWGEKPDVQSVSTSLDLNYISAVFKDKEFIAVSRVVKFGRSVAFTEFEIRNEKGEAMVTGAHQKAIIQPK